MDSDTRLRLEASLDDLVARAATSGFDDALAASLRAIAADPAAWPAMRAYADGVLERADVEVAYDFATAVRGVCPPGPGWISDASFANETATPLLFLRWLPGPAAVARRCVCLVALYARGFWEHRQSQGEEPAPDVPAAIGAWLDAEGLGDEVSPAERRLFDVPAGSWSADERWDASWRGEALGVLGWALGLHEAIPPVGLTFDPDALLASVPLHQPTDAFVASARLRDAGDLEAALERTEFWLWRARSKGRGTAILSPVVRDAVAYAVERGFFAETIEGDAPVFGKPYFRISDAEESDVFPAIYQRHFATCWLRGYGYGWDDTTTDT